MRAHGVWTFVVERAPAVLAVAAAAFLGGGATGLVVGYATRGRARGSPFDLFDALGAWGGDEGLLALLALLVLLAVAALGYHFGARMGARMRERWGRTT